MVLGADISFCKGSVKRPFGRHIRDSAREMPLAGRSSSARISLGPELVGPLDNDTITSTPLKLETGPICKIVEVFQRAVLHLAIPFPGTVVSKQT
jgi:hypothetical protein